MMFFFLLIRRPPRSTLFPYTTSSDLKDAVLPGSLRGERSGSRTARCRGWARSEEHTSELQSRFDLVCRLLLEKKKSRSSPPPTPAGRRWTVAPAPLPGTRSQIRRAHV